MSKIISDRPDCPPDGGQCTWGWSYGQHYVKYINAACLKHSRAEAVRNGQRVSAA